MTAIQSFQQTLYCFPSLIVVVVSMGGEKPEELPAARRELVPNFNLMSIQTVQLLTLDNVFKALKKNIWKAVV